MRRPWLALFLALLNVNFGLSALRSQIKRRERTWEILLVGASIAAGVGVVTWVVARLAAVIVAAGLQFGQPEIVLTVAHFLAAVMVLLFGLAYVMGTFYFANDTAFLMAWPLSARQVLSAKFATVLVNEYLTALVVLVPVYVVYALHVPVGPLYIPSAVLVFLLTPVIPLAVAAFAVVLLMRVVSFARRRDFFTMVGTLVLVIAAVAAQYFLQSMGPDLAGEAEIAELMFGQAHGISKLASQGYPPSYWSMLALEEAGSAAGFAGLAGLAAGALIGVGVLLFAGERFFLGAAQTAGQAGARRSRRKAELGDASPVRSVARVERKLFLRTPMYVLNGFAGALLVPLLIMLPGLTQDEAITALLGSGLRNPYVGLAAIWGWFPLATAMSLIPATAFSREGRRLWALKCLPISGREVFLGKLLAAETMTFPAAVPGALVLAYVMRLDPAVVVLGIALGALSSVLVAVFSLGVDMARPWLTWTDPTRAIKSNANGLIGTVAAIALTAASAAAGVFLTVRGIPASAVVILFAALHAAALLGLWRWLAPRFDPLFQRMGD